MATTLLYPFAQSTGQPIPLFVSTSETPIPYGGGGVADDSDASYWEQGAQTDITSVAHIEPVSGDFAAPASMNPTALVVQFRARTSPATLGNAPGADVTRYIHWYFTDTATGAEIHSESSRTGNMVPLIEGTAASAEWYTVFYGGLTVDLDNPTPDGNWADMPTFPEMKDALTGSGLRLSVFPYSGQEGRIPWMDLFELRLLVAYESVGRGATYNRVVQRGNDGLGITGGQRIVQQRTIQASNRRVGIR